MCSAATCECGVTLTLMEQKSKFDTCWPGGLNVVHFTPNIPVESKNQYINISRPALYIYFFLKSIYLLEFSVLTYKCTAVKLCLLTEQIPAVFHVAVRIWAVGLFQWEGRSRGEGDGERGAWLAAMRMSLGLAVKCRPSSLFPEMVQRAERGAQNLYVQ